MTLVFLFSLGNHILSDSDLIHFHNDLLHDQDISTPLSKRSLVVNLIQLIFFKLKLLFL
jgi:hypothetical protein